MIRIPILDDQEIAQLPNAGAIRGAEKAKLEGLIAAASPTWMTRAQAKTDYFKQAGQYSEDTLDALGHPGPGSPIWSEVKSIYMDIQSNKCAFCEQKPEDQPIVHDVEHFRPKKNVKVWLTKKRKTETGYDFPDVKSAGYHLLPYNILNYAAACKHCNSVLKSDYFPISGTRTIDRDDVDSINNLEKPFLLFPLGTIDDDKPEDLITFTGPWPSVNQALADPHKKLRAEVTIKFFNLDASQGKIREGLVVQRCEMIKQIYDAMTIIQLSPDQAHVARKKADLELWTSGNKAHTNCAKCYTRLCFSDPVLAREYYDKADDYIKSHRKK